MKCMKTMDELHAWSSLEESENEQWQEVNSKKSKTEDEEVYPRLSLLSVVNSSCASLRKVTEVKDNWAKHQSHNEHMSCRACRADRGVPASGTGLARAQQRNFLH